MEIGTADAVRLSETKKKVKIGKSEGKRLSPVIFFGDARLSMSKRKI